MRNTRARDFDYIEHLSKAILVGVVLAFALMASHSPTLAQWMHGGERTMTVTSAPSEDVPAAMATPLTTTATDLAPDTTDEGRDVLVVRYDDAPADLWQGLLDAGYRGTGADGCECLSVPVDTVVDVHGGLYLATLDGWAGCRDGWFAQECSATGPVVMLDVPQQSTVPTVQST